MSEAAAMHRLVDATAGDYEIIREIGRGGMATVYLARDCALDRRVAIKVMAPQLLAVEGMAERFLQEARVSAALTHPHIVPIHAVRRSGDLLYFVMRYVAGRSLDVILAEHGPLPIAMVRAVLTQVGGALEAAHRRGIVHRDIKPANILIDEKGDAVVADFGIARLVEQPGQTLIGQTVGTPEYMSPEQCAGGALTGAADQYSLGVVAYELLTGAPPYRGESLMQVVWQMVQESIPPLATRRPECAGQLSAAVHRMLAGRAEERWPGIAEAVAALPPLVLASDDPARRALAALASGTRTDPPAAVRLPSSAATVVTPSRAVPAERALGAAIGEIRLPYASGLMSIDDEVVLAAEVRDVDGSSIDGAPVQWESNAPTVARVAADGTLTAVGTGRAAITARAGDAWASLALTVTRAGLRALLIAPRPATLEVGDRVALQVASREAGGTAAVTRLVQWTSSDPAIARVDALGEVRAIAEGLVQILARCGGTTGVLDLRVTRAMISAVQVTIPSPRLAIGAQVRLAAAPSNTRGHPLMGLDVRWEVSDPAIAAISPDGVLTGLRSGQVLVAARVSGRVGTARVTVSAAP